MTEALLTQLLAGQRAMHTRVLQNCRLEGTGTTVYGRDAIAQVFASAPVSTGPTLVLEAASSHVVIAPDDHQAIWADVHEGHLRRIWVCSDRPWGQPRLERIDVPFDPELDQRSPAIAFDPADHPELNGDDAAAVGVLAAPYLAAVGPHGLLHTRPTVLRAVSAPAGVAALIVVLGKVAARTGIFRHDVIAFAPRDGGASVAIADLAGLARALARAWEPRL